MIRNVNLDYAITSLSHRVHQRARYTSHLNAAKSLQVLRPIISPYSRYLHIELGDTRGIETLFGKIRDIGISWVVKQFGVHSLLPKMGQASAIDGQEIRRDRLIDNLKVVLLKTRKPSVELKARLASYRGVHNGFLFDC